MRMSLVLVSLLLGSACAEKQDRESASTPVAQRSERPIRESSTIPDEIKNFAERLPAISASEYPDIASVDFVMAPTWTELQPLIDSSKPLSYRLETLMGLSESTRSVMKMYANRDLKRYKTSFKTAMDSSEALNYSISALNQFAALTPILIDEFLPTLDASDPSYGTRLKGLEKMRTGLFSMVKGASMTLRSRKSKLVDRRLLAAAIHQRSRALASILRPGDSLRLHELLTGVEDKETDAQIRADLDGALAQLRIHP